MKRLSLVLILAALALPQAGQATTWWRTFGGPDRDEGTCVQQTSDSGYIVTGVTWSFGRPHESDIWLIKLDSLGHKEWDRTYEAGWGRTVRQTSDGGYLIGGYRLIKTDNYGDTLWTRDYGGISYCVQETNEGDYVIAGQKSDALWLLKLNKDGDNIWERLYPRGNYGSQSRYVEVTVDGNYFVTGSFTDTMMIGEEDILFKGALWLLEFNDEGDTMWTKAYESEEWETSYYGFCGRETFDGGYIIIGSWLMKTDEHGDSVWTKTFTGAPSGTLYCVEQTSDSGYIIVGEGKAGTLLSAPVGGDLLLIKTDENGDTIWTRGYGGDETDVGDYIQQTTDKGYIATGSTNSYGSGRNDLYIIKTDSLGLLAVNENPMPLTPKNWNVLIPLGTQILLKYWDCPQGFHASIYDALGRKIDVLESTGSSGILSWGNGYPAGVYFIHAPDAKKANNTVRIIIIR